MSDEADKFLACVAEFERIEELKNLKEKTDAFIADVFDWVAPLDERSLLQRLYDFKGAIEREIHEQQTKTSIHHSNEVPAS